MIRIYAVADPTSLDPEYADGLRAAVTAAVDYGLLAIELGEDRSPPPPPALLAQARMAARAGVSLDTVLRRYFAGHALLGDFVIEEVEGGGLLRGPALQRLLRTQATLFDRLLAAVSEEHGREGGSRQPTSEGRRAERIERLIAGELVDTSGLGYEFGSHHLGAIVAGPSAGKAIENLASSLDRQLLTVHRHHERIWAWLGGRRRIDLDDLQSAVSCALPVQVSLSIGEPAQGLRGWRLTHRQARAALPVALRSQQSFTRYADVALLASMLQDELLVNSLRQLYLAPLSGERDGGATLRHTLRAYFACERNSASAAATLGVTRQTVNNRLRAIERRVGRPLAVCASEMEGALRLSELDGEDAQSAISLPD